MKSVSEMSVDEFSHHLKSMNEQVRNFHLYGGSNVGKRTDRSYANQKRGDFFGKNMGVQMRVDIMNRPRNSKYDG